MSPTDIITYIGVPLAVAGVLPILAVVIKTFIFSIRVRRRLWQNLDVIGLFEDRFWSSGSSGPITRSGDPKLQPGKSYFDKLRYYSIDVDVLLGQVNLSFPVLQLQVLPEKHALYKRMRGDVKCRSRLRGGTWSILYFVPEVVKEDDSNVDAESRTYVLRPTDTLSQRPAQIGFSALVQYLLDLGAVAHPTGWADLRKDGLGVKNRTVLLTSKSGQSVLVVRKQEDEEDDRLLAVLLDWTGVQNLFEEQPACFAAKPSTISIRYGLQNVVVDSNQYQAELTPSQRTSIDLTISGNGMVSASIPHSETGKAIPLDTSHLSLDNGERPSPGTWFSSVAVAVGANKHVYTNYVIPAPLFHFAHDAYHARPFMPCGVLHYCGLVRVQDCAPWTPEGPDVTDLTSEYNEGHHSQSTQRPDGSQNEASPPMTRDTSMSGINPVDRTRILHALASPRWSISTVSKHVIVWMHNRSILEYTANTNDVAELILHRMVHFPAEAEALSEMLNRWHLWYQNGVGAEDVLYIEGHRTLFALASCLLYALGKYTNSRDGRTPGLLEECLTKWKDVSIY